MQALEIKNADTLRTWLEERPDQSRVYESVLIAHRTAMRVLPIWIGALAEPWAGRRFLTAMPILRACLISGAHEERATTALQNAARSAEIFAAAETTDSSSFPPQGFEEAARAMSASAFAARAVFASSDAPAFAARATAFASPAECVPTIRADAVAFAAKLTPRKHPLWQRLRNGQIGKIGGLLPVVETPDWHTQAWTKSRDWLTSNPGHDFWIRWYEAALEGRPLTDDWESHAKLISDIALIPDEDWEKGAEHVAKLIAEIEERYRLLAETRRLKTELAPVVSDISAAPIGHNHPPEGLDDVPPVRSILLIWETLDAAEKELEKSKPEKRVLRQIALTMLDASVAVAKYCGKLANTAVQKAAEEVGTSSVKWGIRLGAGTFAAHMLGLDDAIRTLAEALARYSGG